MAELYIANKNYSSWSLRPWVLMRTLGIPFEERLVPFAPDGRHTFSSFSPTGKVPCLVDAGNVVWDSLAIAEYLAERHAGVWPADTAARTWARCAAAEMHSGFATLRSICSMNCGVRVALREITDALRADIARIDSMLGEGLARFGGPWLAGAAFTGADAFYAPVAFRIRIYGLQLSAPVMAWVERTLALPAMRDWYAAALTETWRIGPYEEAIGRAGTLVEDLRAV